MKPLCFGSKGPDVKRWQNFLIGAGFLRDEADGTFGKNTDAATKAFQKAHGLRIDGVVGNRTLARAMEAGYSAIDMTPVAEESREFPPRPAFAPMSGSARERHFGTIDYVAAPTRSNPEAIRITNGWSSHVITVPVPQLIGIPGAPASGKVKIHRAIAPQFVGLWKAWEDRGLLNLVLGFAGTWVPRFIRGSRTTLSAHAWATAFDINVPWNGLGVVPAARGTRGSVRELVPTANEFGFYWGGHFEKRPDGMHFEVATINAIP
jgi:D-alanyl-D-alanine carboxypeptidase/Putative peptidoglycan binding domain